MPDEPYQLERCVIELNGLPTEADALVVGGKVTEVHVWPLGILDPDTVTFIEVPMSAVMAPGQK